MDESAKTRHDMGGLMDFPVWYLTAAVTHLAGLRSIPLVYREGNDGRCMVDGARCGRWIWQRV